METKINKVTLTAGLSFGDEGKGSVVDHLVRKHSSSTVVRYNGGAQAAHNVVLADGRHHTFAQFGSGTLVPGCRTHLSRFMLVNPISLLQEEKHLQEIGFTDACSRMTVERTALITNPFQVAANRLREMLRAEGRHGSCGMGIGETMADWEDYPEDALRVEDLDNLGIVKRKLATSMVRKYEELAPLVPVSKMTPEMLREWRILTDIDVINTCARQYSYFESCVEVVDDTYLPKLLKEPGAVVFEGAQGVLLDQDWGFFPYVTRTTTTFDNALALIKGFDDKFTKLGVMRAYSTRHGPGPFPTEDASLNLPDTHNGFGPWQRNFRFGHLDLMMTRYAIDRLGGVDEIVMTNVDRVKDQRTWKVCTGYYGDNRQDDYLGGMDPYFDVHNGDIEGFKPPLSLQKRAKFSAALSKVEPLYEEFHDLDSMISFTSRHLRRADSPKDPITLCSFGPTAEDKKPR